MLTQHSIPLSLDVRLVLIVRFLLIPVKCNFVKGEMAEWSKAAGCKPVSNTHVGSNPTLLI